VCLLLPRKVQRSGAVAISLENLLRDFYCRTTAESKLFDCPFRVAAPLSAGRSCSVPLKSQLCECLAAKRGPLFWRFAQKLILRAVDNGRETNRLGYFYPVRSPSSAVSPLLLVTRLPYCRGREALPKTTFLRQAIHAPKNAQTRDACLARAPTYAWEMLRERSYVLRGPC